MRSGRHGGPQRDSARRGSRARPACASRRTSRLSVADAARCPFPILCLLKIMSYKRYKTGLTRCRAAELASTGTGLEFPQPPAAGALVARSVSSNAQSRHLDCDAAGLRRPHRSAPFPSPTARNARHEKTRSRCRHRRRRPDRLRLLFRIAAGEMLGRDQPVILQLLELPIDKAQAALKGVMMELEDCAFPAARRHDRHRRSEGRVQGRRLSRCWSAPGRADPAWSARTCCWRTPRSSSSRARRSTPSPSRDVRVLVVGNPANTNAYIAMKSAPSLPKKNFTAMLRLDHNRALSQLAAQDRQAGRLRSRSSASGATIRRRCTPTTASPRSTASRSRR